MLQIIKMTSENRTKKPWKLSIKEMRDIAQPTSFLKRPEEHIFSRFYRFFSIYLTKFLLFLRLTPNMVTWLMIITGIAASIMFVFPSFVLACVGFLLFQLWVILDSSDGEVARITNKLSIFGPYLDRLNHYIIDMCLLFSLGMKIYLLTGEIIFLLLGTILCIINIFSRVVLSAFITVLIQNKVYEKILFKSSSNRNISKEKLEDEDNAESRKDSILVRMVNFGEKLKLRRLFTGTIEIAAIFLLASMFYLIFPNPDIFIYLLYVYMGGNLINVFARFMYVYLNIDKLVIKAFEEGIHF